MMPSWHWILALNIEYWYWISARLSSQTYSEGLGNYEMLAKCLVGNVPEFHGFLRGNSNLSCFNSTATWRTSFCQDWMGCWLTQGPRYQFNNLLQRIRSIQFLLCIILAFTEELLLLMHLSGKCEKLLERKSIKKKQIAEWSFLHFQQGGRFIVYTIKNLNPSFA